MWYGWFSNGGSKKGSDNASKLHFRIFAWFTHTLRGVQGLTGKLSDHLSAWYANTQWVFCPFLKNDSSTLLHYKIKQNGVIFIPKYKWPFLNTHWHFKLSVNAATKQTNKKKKRHFMFYICVAVKMPQEKSHESCSFHATWQHFKSTRKAEAYTLYKTIYLVNNCGAEHCIKMSKLA